jgi:hypothetical protein
MAKKSNDVKSAGLDKREPPRDRALDFIHRAGDKVGSQGTALAGVVGFLLAWYLSNKIVSIRTLAEAVVFFA